MGSRNIHEPEQQLGPSMDEEKHVETHNGSHPQMFGILK